MFEREGYASLADLWLSFEKKFRLLCQRRALEAMEADRVSTDFLFGTALDLCEDVFLRTFDSLKLCLVPLEGEVVKIAPILPHSGARLLLKTSFFESYEISMSPEEAGPDGEWLYKIGSSAFSGGEIEWLWPGTKGRSIGPELKEILFSKIFHTLPILFERPTFIIANERPPWSMDLLEDAYVRNVWHDARGCAICLSNASKKDWERLLTAQNVEAIISHLISGSPMEPITVNRRKGGRPEKVSVVIQALIDLGLLDKQLSRKNELRLIEKHLEDRVGLSTLDRAKRELRDKGPV